MIHKTHVVTHQEDKNTCFKKQNSFCDDVPVCPHSNSSFCPSRPHAPLTFGLGSNKLRPVKILWEDPSQLDWRAELSGLLERWENAKQSRKCWLLKEEENRISVKMENWNPDLLLSVQTCIPGWSPHCHKWGVTINKVHTYSVFVLHRTFIPFCPHSLNQIFVSLQKLLFKSKKNYLNQNIPHFLEKMWKCFVFF